jgi:hypothetical protein
VRRDIGADGSSDERTGQACGCQDWPALRCGAVAVDGSVCGAMCLCMKAFSVDGKIDPATQPIGDVYVVMGPAFSGYVLRGSVLKDVQYHGHETLDVVRDELIVWWIQVFPADGSCIDSLKHA